MPRFKFFFKIVVSALLLFLILRLVDFDKIVLELNSVPISILILVFAGYAFGQIVSAYKWWLISNSYFPEKTFQNALTSYFMGMLINIFGLGIVGGDFARAAIFSSNRTKLVEALGTVAADRIHGFLMLVSIGFISILIFGLDSSVAHFDLILLALVGLFIFSWFFAPKIIDSISRFSPKINEQFKRLFSSFPKNKTVLLKISSISILFHCFQIFLHYIIIKSFGVEIPFSYLLCTIPLINIFSSLPISWMGLGIREVGYVFFLTPIFLNKETAIALGAIWFLANIFASVLGGLIAYWQNGLGYNQLGELINNKLIKKA